MNWHARSREPRKAPCRPERDDAAVGEDVAHDQSEKTQICADVEDRAVTEWESAEEILFRGRDAPRHRVEFRESVEASECHAADVADRAPGAKSVLKRPRRIVQCQ